MKRIITIAILMIVSLSAFAQYNDNYTELDFSSESVQNIEMGTRHIANGGIALTSTILFDAVYFPILTVSSKKNGVVNAEALQTGCIIGATFTTLGVIISLCEFAKGESMVRRGYREIGINKNGALCITLEGRRDRRK